MNKFKNILPMIAVLTGIVLAVGTSAFKKADNKKENFANVYFRYSGPNESDANLQDASNWQEVTTGLPGTNPCTPGSIVCFTHLDNTILQNQSGADNKAKFVFYLNNVVDPSDYVQATSDWEKQ